MKKLVEIIAKALVDHPDAVVVNEIDKEQSIVLELRVADEDMGKVIGKQGKIAKAMRTIVRAATPRGSKRYVVEIKEKGGNAVNRETEEEAADAENADAE